MSKPNAAHNDQNQCLFHFLKRVVTSFQRHKWPLTKMSTMDATVMVGSTLFRVLALENTFWLVGILKSQSRSIYLYVFKSLHSSKNAIWKGMRKWWQIMAAEVRCIFVWGHFCLWKDLPCQRFFESRRADIGANSTCQTFMVSLIADESSGMTPFTSTVIKFLLFSTPSFYEKVCLAPKLLDRLSLLTSIRLHSFWLKKIEKCVMEHTWWKQGGLDAGDRERGWNWVDVIRHLSQTGGKPEGS